MKKLTHIPFLELESIPQLIKDFLTQKIVGFEDKVFNFENVERQIILKEQSFSSSYRSVLLQVLKDQYEGCQLTASQNQNIQYLSKDAFTITTGHQLNLFTGPSFFVYKILQTIKFAAVLNEKYSTKKFVPIFWMASEDHDFEEINHFKTESNYYETKAKSGGAVGRIKIEDDFFLQQFEEEFENSVFGTELILLLKRAYRKGNTLAQATRIIVQELFSEYGLLVIDGDDDRLKAEMKTPFKEELLQQNLYNTTKETVSFLSHEYGKVQVNPREINLFYLSETRDRIAFENGKYVIVDKDLHFSKEEILEELESHPERFSPNALMRPVFQETILPNIAYIGGNAEIMYWLELKDYFKHLNLPFPLLIPRNSMLMIPQKTISKAEKLDLRITDLFKNFSTLSKKILLKDNRILNLLDEQEIILTKHFAQLKNQAESTDKTFGNLVQAEQTRQLKSFERMKKRLLRAEKIKQHEKLERLENIFLSVHPGKIWQERTYNFSVFYSDLGKEWLDTCYEGMEIDNSELIIFTV
ncbi:bacillithiol biosynthesis cysteine-adding enzyme BshC [Chryseobacterium sp. SNU WT5]|uniref:bacillithiol biosynthesis cysteine-adding enzyme BshC n=1 Tax=Chryseobacterium sp. SNU WT5 TaxID=2594269 RepID=UPI00117E6714|nr:bacillithiol biosynthesis cysteine-adding enzyme BshC [Chryseobacterium sp. SNU WT5]QDP85561.1 bacillithiol biosynthesis cysteine-adding enzyme BshC [Chryseobacterium sp. SNU WT5]